MAMLNAFNGGAVMGYAVASLGLLGLGVLIWIYGSDFKSFRASAGRLRRRSYLSGSVCPNRWWYLHKSCRRGC